MVSAIDLRHASPAAQTGNKPAPSSLCVFSQLWFYALLQAPLRILDIHSMLFRICAVQQCGLCVLQFFLGQRLHKLMQFFAQIIHGRSR